jgi:DNA-binding LytR/AlgR family response regulator
MSGADVFREVRRLNPHAKIILTSAYDRAQINASPGACALGEGARFSFIRKPYRIGELVRMLREAVR